MNRNVDSLHAAVLSLLLILCSIMMLPGDVRAATQDGWFEVTRGSDISAAADPKEQPSARDVEWIAQPGDDFPSIAYEVTGSRAHAMTIARYNRHSLKIPIAGGALIMVPGSMVKPAFRRLKRELVAALPDLPVTKAPEYGSDVTPRNETTNIDMFVGEVKVMGPVDVSRVANGNGNILRAEVIDSGELMIIAQAEGSSSVRLWHNDGTQSDYNIRVSLSDPETRVRMETMVRMRVRMVEFRKSALGKLGIDWSDSIEGPGAAIAGDIAGNDYFRPGSDGVFSTLPNTVKPFSTYLGVAAQISSRINLLASTGDAKTLAEPVLSTMNGGSASFLAGGEVPYPSIGSNGQTVVQFKEYGIKLKVSPSVDPSGLVRTLIDTEISQLDPAVSVQGAPGLLSRKAQTEVNVRSGETIVISGLLSSESSKDIDKIPGIARVPVLGRFFRSQNARNTVNELVIFVTPEVVQPQQILRTERESRILQSSDQRMATARRKLLLLE